MSYWLDHPIFVLGYSKSGTSLLMAILDNHPQLVVLPEESNFMDNLYLICHKIKRKVEIEERDIELIISTLKKTRLRLLEKGKLDNEIGGNLDYSNFDYKQFLQKIREQIQKIMKVDSKVKIWDYG